MNRALLLIDIQNDFLPGGALAVPEGDEIIPIVNRMMDDFDWVVATQDWHPPNHGSFASNSSEPDAQPGMLSELDGLPQVLWPDHCIQNTKGAEFSRELDQSRIVHITQKGLHPLVDSYSGFFDNARRQSTDLAEFLNSHSVHEVHLVGLATDYCVKFTALDAVDLGFKTVVHRKAIRGVELSPGDCEKAIEEMKESKVSVIDG